jgi:hypothetical protein
LATIHKLFKPKFKNGIRKFTMPLGNNYTLDCSCGGTITKNYDVGSGETQIIHHGQVESGPGMILKLGKLEYFELDNPSEYIDNWISRVHTRLVQKVE